MSLKHDFLLIEKQHLLNDGYMNHYHSSKALHLHDDFISYIYDSLEWIPAFNPSTNEFQKGINRWGITVFEVEGAKKIRSIFSSWSALFSEGPEILNLEGEWTYYEESTDEYGDEGKYDRLILLRNEIVETLLEISSWANQIIESDGEFYI